MKKNLLAIGAVALAILATQQAAQATITVTDGYGNFISSSTPTTVIPVYYDVTFNGSLYTYLYSFTPLQSGPIENFNINASYVNSVLTAGTAVSSATLNGDITLSGANNSTLVEWSFFPNNATTTQLVGFTSTYGPGLGSGGLIDDGTGPWGDNAVGSPIPVPVPVPEASTVLAGALMLLPFGIGAVRSLRKERVV
jgi:hypothetical protein